MKKKDRTVFIMERLGEMYPDPKPPLFHENNFELLIAVLLSAQCTDERVNRVTPQLFSGGGNPSALLRLGISEVQKIIRPCGLSPKKSSAIVLLSQILISKFKGQVPRTFVDLETLPGVGHKTASVVMSQGFGVPAFPVDTHIHRLSQRWGLTRGKNVMQTENDLKRLFPIEKWNELHLQIIFYGRDFCTARSCGGLICEICRTCFPKRRKKVITWK
tara:strand:- start:278 stop:928 length:651 start_codon:yes stop_codon:yes gene_type:complete